jgi:hydroxymethylbilane synthase
LAQIEDGMLHFMGSITSVDGKEKIEIEKNGAVDKMGNVGKEAALEILANGGDRIMASIRNGNR